MEEVLRQVLEIDWNIVSAISTSVGTIATTGACIIALWQTRLANEKRAKVTVVEDSVFVDSLGRGYDDVVYLGLRMTNTGNKAIIIKNAGFSISGDKLYYSVIPHFCSDGNNVAFSEHVVAPEQSISFFFGKDRLLEQLKEKNKMGRKVSFFLSDTSGKQYYAKSLRLEQL